MSGYVPDAGDIVWTQFDPQAGHEQAGHRPALVLSPASYNGIRGMMIVCPMTSRLRPYVFQVIASEDPPSAVIADQIKSIDWRARGVRFKSRASPAVVAETRARLRSLLLL